MTTLINFSEQDERESNAAFQLGMDLLDRALLAELVPVPGRPIEATRRIAMARGTTLIMAGPETSPTVDAVFGWYEERYGDRLKIDLSPGSAVVVVRGDPMVMKLPLIIGQWDGIIDITKLLPGLTQPMFAALRESEMQDIITTFPWFRERFEAIEALPQAIRVNLDTAIMQMTSQSPHYGESRWASLQFAEKALKHFLRAQKRTSPFTHNLAVLLDRCEAAGFPRGCRPLLAAIQCPAAVRYETNSTLDAAIAAHHSSIDLAAKIAAHMAGHLESMPIIDKNDLADMVLSMDYGIEQSHDGNLLFVLAMGDGSHRHLLLSGNHCAWLQAQLKQARAQGRHADERPIFSSGRDLRNAPPRHPLRLFDAHRPHFGPKDYEMPIFQVVSIRALDEANAVVLEIEATKNEYTRLLIASELIAVLVEMFEEGLTEGRAHGLFANL
ncbi:HEPN domain-containing protein [Sphingobium baderi]|uniref:hypothetical protein n=1 Tax=Sphingobium baderi TaxID=1332080 RepID=UPI002B40D21D|nr:hypothetical protein [Sphingobium baderi]WRD75065.1 hypothetical protein QQ987_09585 [Sphingobium baderi]